MNPFIAAIREVAGTTNPEKPNGFGRDILQHGGSHCGPWLRPVAGRTDGRDYPIEYLLRLYRDC